MPHERNKDPKNISRRQFLRDAGIVVGGTAVGSAFILTACGEEKEITKTVTKTDTVTTTAPGTTVTQTATETATKYVCPVCNEEFDSLDELKNHFESEHPDDKEIKDELDRVVTYTVNGHQYVLQVDPQETLHDVLREKCGYLSLKDMCTGWGACGSCTVIVEGKPILGCMALAREFDGANMETSEGLAQKKHPLIDTYVKHYTMQCGYCTPGFIVTSKALLDMNPNPTVEDIRDKLAGNLCRCGTYPQHIPAVQEAAEILQQGGE